MSNELSIENLNTLRNWKEIDGLTNAQIAARYNKERKLKGASRLTPNRVKKLLKGIPSKHHTDLERSIKERKSNFDSFFYDLVKPPKNFGANNSAIKKQDRSYGDSPTPLASFRSEDTP